MGRTGSLRLKEEARDVSREKREGRGRAGLILEKFRGGGRRRLAGREGGEGGKVKARFDPPFLSFAPNSISAQISSFLHRTRLWTSLPSDRPLHFTMESSSSSSKNKRMRTVVASSPRSSSSLPSWALPSCSKPELIRPFSASTGRRVRRRSCSQVRSYQRGGHQAGSRGSGRLHPSSTSSPSSLVKLILVPSSNLILLLGRSRVLQE